MPVVATTKATRNVSMIAALLAISVNWDDDNSVTVKEGRRGEYRTTSAQMERIRVLNDEEAQELANIAGSMGLDVSEGELKEFFSGDFEYQISYACNRFATVTGGRTQRLTAKELRTLEQARNILADKEAAAARFLTTAKGEKAA